MNISVLGGFLREDVESSIRFLSLFFFFRLVVGSYECSLLGGIKGEGY